VLESLALVALALQAALVARVARRNLNRSLRLIDPLAAAHSAAASRTPQHSASTHTPPSAMSSSTPLVSSTPQWQSLEEHAASPAIAASHLRSLLQDAERCASMQAEFDGILLDYSRQRITGDTMNMLFG